MIAIKTDELSKRFPRTSDHRRLQPFKQQQWTQAVKGISLDIKEGLISYWNRLYCL